MAKILEREKQITVGEYDYILHRFDARTGTYVMKIVIQKALPLFTALQEDAKKSKKRKIPEADGMTDGQFIDMLVGIISDISAADIDFLMNTCLRNTDRIVKSGKAPCMDGKHFGFEDLEYDTITCLQLCAQSIVFNFSDFFGGSGLTSLFGQTNTSPLIP